MAKKPQRDVYQDVTNKILAMLEKGIDGGDWMKPWRAAAGHGLPSNAVTHREYRGVNVLTLWGAAMENDYLTNEWASFNQWRSRECMVRKGEHGSTIVFFKAIRVRDEDSTEPDGKRRIPLLRYSTVFNGAQVDGYEPPETEPIPEVDLIDHLEGFVANTGAVVKENASDRAYYNTGKDYIAIPKAGQFTDIESRYSVLFHELTHWSGAKHRLDRDLRGRFGSASYAAEELVAELGSAFLCGGFDLEPEPREDHAQYLAHWVQLLRDDKKAIVSAAAKASDAAEYLHGHNREADAERELAVAS